MPSVPARDIELYYERKGEGAPLLFISGTGADLRVRPNVFDGPVATSFDLIAYDQRGLGRSGKPDRPYSMAEYADDAAALLRELRVQSAYVLGVSFGGMVAQELVLRHPQLVTKLVLACTSPGGDGGASYPLHELEHMGREERARFLMPISDRKHDAAWQATHPKQVDLMLAMSTANPFGDEPGHEVGRRRQLEARARHDTWERLPSIACPTLICGGTRDGIATSETQQRLAAQIPGAQLRLFEGGHLFTLQDREAIPAMIAFLRA